MGTQGFLIGDATYRFEHDGDTLPHRDRRRRRAASPR